MVHAPRSVKPWLLLGAEPTVSFVTQGKSRAVGEGDIYLVWAVTVPVLAPCS